MAAIAKKSGGPVLLVVLLLALAGLLAGLVWQARSNRDRVSNLETRIEAQRIEARRLAERLEALGTDASRAKLLAREHRERAADLEKKLVAVTGELDRATAELARTRAERDEHLAARLDTGGRLDATETALATEILDRRERVSELEGRLADSREVAARLGREVRRMAARVEDLEVRLALREDAFAALTAKTEEFRAASKARAASLERDLAAALERAVELKARAEELRKANAELEEARDEMARRLKALIEERKREAGSTGDSAK